MEMKFITFVLSIILLSTVAFLGCQKESKEPILAQTPLSSLFQANPLEEEKCDKMVHTAALGLLELSKNSQFRSLVHEKCLEMFDGDYNVLLKDLKVPSEDMGLDLATEFESSIATNYSEINVTDTPIAYGHFDDAGHIAESIDGFDYYEEKHYLQIYVPNFEDEESESPKTVPNQQPIIVVHPRDNSTNEDAYVYVLQDDGTFKTQIISPSFAENNLIWVISINETPPASNVATMASGTNSISNSLQPKASNRTVEKVKHLMIKNITILDKKRRFLERQGRSL